MTKTQAFERRRHDQAHAAHDYRAVTEAPGILLNQEQIGRFAHRYRYGAELGRDRRVLEVACGAGSGAGIVRRGATRYVGLDYTAGVLHTMRAHYGARLPLAQGDAEQLPFASATFDLVLCFEAIYYLDNYRAFLTECGRVLANAGRLLIVQSNPGWGDFVPGALSYYYPPSPELVESLTAAGFTDVQLLGALPTTRATPRQALVNHLRYLVLRPARQLLGGRLAGAGGTAVTTLLKRILYGRLAPLPTELTQVEAQTYATSVSLTPLDPRRTDHTHRVHYIYAESLCRGVHAAPA